MILSFRISGDDTILDNALTDFVTHHGWEGGDMESKLEYARSTMRRFVQESVKAQRVAQAHKTVDDMVASAIQSSFGAFTTTFEVIE